MADKEGNWFMRHKILTAIIAVVLIAGIASAASGGDSDTQTSSEASETSNESSDNGQVTKAKIGEPARDGKFEFIVKDVECGKSRVGDQYLGTDAQGEFCFVNMTIKNISDVSQSLLADDQYVYDAEGNRYSADSEASIYSNDSGSTWYDEINPGNSVSGAVIFDVPKGTKIVKAELHDSAFSNGIEVNLQ